MTEVKDDTLAKAKQEAEAKSGGEVKAAQEKAAEILAKAKQEAEAIKKAAQSEAKDLVSKGVSKKQLVDGYNKGLNHAQLAEKFFGSHSEENVAKVAAAINADFGLTDDIDAKNVKVVTEHGEPEA